MTSAEVRNISSKLVHFCRDLFELDAFLLNHHKEVAAFLKAVQNYFLDRPCRFLMTDDQ
jgi:hypothetical protein